MKNKLMVSVLALSTMFGISSAQIPVTDGANLTYAQMQGMKELTEMANQLATAKSQLDTAMNQLNAFKQEAESMKKRLEGFSNLGNSFQGLDYQKALDMLAEQVNNAENIDKFLKDNGILESSKDSVADYAKKHGGYTAMQNELKVHQSNLEKLQQEASKADTPQKREAVANATAIETARMNAKQATLELEQLKQEEVQKAKQRDEFNKFNEKTNSVPDWLKGGFSIDIQ